MTPFHRESPISPAMTEKAKIIRAKISTGPMNRATAAIGAETVIRTMSLNVSPVAEAYRAILVAFSGLPLCARG